MITLKNWVAVFTAAAVALIGGMVLQARSAGAAGLGCQVSLGAGASMSNSSARLTDSTTGIEMLSVGGLGANGGALGVGFGCSIAVDRIMLGADIEHVWHNATWNAASGPLAVAVELDRQVFLTGRAGVIINDSSVVYMRAGVTKMSTSGLTGTFTADFGDFSGKVLGGGFEIGIGKHVKLALDYRHSWFDAKTGVVMDAFGPAGGNLNLKPEQDLVMLNLIYSLDFFGSVLPVK